MYACTGILTFSLGLGDKLLLQQTDIRICWAFWLGAYMGFEGEEGGSGVAVGEEGVFVYSGEESLPDDDG